MKILVAHLTSECNEHISHQVELKDFKILYGEEAVHAMHIDDILEKENIEAVPAIYAGLHPDGMIKREAFDFICDKILASIKEHLSEIDGLYLQFHGASGVLDLECVSAEHYLLKRIREVVGEHMPIAMIMDPHGNLTKELAGRLNIVRCYRESPHSDQVESERLVLYKLIDLLRNRRDMHPIIRKLPILIGGERSVSAKEPVRSINRLLDEAEKDERVFSDSFHVGYIRHDDDKLGVAIVVIPNTPDDIEYCEQVADNIAQYTWDHRHEFQFSGNFAEPDESIEMAISKGQKTTVITDSGDNCGAGGSGQNTVMLRKLLERKAQKKTLIAGINDEKAHAYLAEHQTGDSVEFDLGANEDELSAPVRIKGTLIATGKQVYGMRDHEVGPAYVVHVENTQLDVIVLDHNIQYGTMEQFEAAGVHFHDYDIVVVKMGYLDVYLIPETSYHVMALTDGSTIQRSERIPFKKIYRPMWPMDEMDKLRYIDR